MHSDITYDFIIAGAGAAGLSLLWRLMCHKDFSGTSILLIDRSFDWPNQKTWSFWNEPDHLIAPFVEHSWDNLTVFSHEDELQETNSQKYYCINSKHFREKILSEAERHLNITRVECDIQAFIPASAVESDLSLASVKTSKGTFKSSYIFQSVLFNTEKDQSQRSGKSLNQVFKGQFIKTDSPCFNPRSMTLMDFRTGPYFQNQTAFFYVLPFSESYALIESTLFTTEHISEDAFDESLKWYITQELGIPFDSARIEKSETGSIPMNPSYTPPNLGKGIISIGSAGGATKSSTGYTFNRTQKHLKAIILALEKNREPTAFQKGDYRFHFYDQLLVDILIRKPHLGSHIFRKLFLHQPIPRILQFLDEETPLAAETYIFSRLPWSPFLTSAARHIML